jgi:hypothetical protein
MLREQEGAERGWLAVGWPVLWVGRSRRGHNYSPGARGGRRWIWATSLVLEALPEAVVLGTLRAAGVGWVMAGQWRAGQAAAGQWRGRLSGWQRWRGYVCGGGTYGLRRS